MKKYIEPLIRDLEKIGAVATVEKNTLHIVSNRGYTFTFTSYDIISRGTDAVFNAVLLLSR